MNSRSSFKSVPFTTFSFRRLACSSLHLIVGFLALSIICLAAPGLAFSQNTSSAGPDAAAEQQTQSLVAQLARYQKAGPAEQAQHLKDLITLAANRRQLLFSLIEENPEAVLRVALPKRLRTSMPDAVQDYLEQRVELEGKLEVLDEDYEDFHRLRHFLVGDGKRYPLHFAENQQGLLSGARVLVRGLLLPNYSEPSGEDGVLIAYCCGIEGVSEGIQVTGSPEPTHTIGEQRTLVLLVNFLDTANDEMPFTPEQAEDAVLGTVSSFFYEASYGQTWLSGDVYGWLTLPFNSTCTSYEIGDAADTAAAAIGVDLSAYSRFIYILKGSGCYWAGSATIGLYPSRAWINGNLNTQVIAHELGHGFGLYHSNFLDCCDTTVGLDCTKAKDDKFDTMGSAPEPGHFNAFQKERLGWFAPGDSITVTADGTYTLQPYELSGDGAYPKVIKVLKETDPETGGATWYYLEYRQALGFDSFITGNENVLNGVLVHTGANFDGETSLLLDMTPNSQQFTFWDRSDPALVVGESFIDPLSGLTFTTDWTDDSGATVSVSFGEPACAQANPTLAISPSESEWVEAGTPAIYNVTVTNNDSEACADTSFGLSAVVPDGWTAAFDNDMLTLAPGASASITLTVTSSLLAPNGSYSMEVMVQNSANPVYNASAAATYVVSAGGDTVAPIVTVTSPKDGANIPSRITIEALASDDSGISRMELYVDEVLKVVKYKSALSWNWNTRKETNGQHTISIKAFDTAENEGIKRLSVYK